MENKLNDQHTVQDILEVQHYGSTSDTLFKILAPIQVTLETCSGITSKDTYNITMFSTTNHWSHNVKNGKWFKSLNSRSEHRHDYFELLLVLEGEITQEIEGKDYLYRAGTCCLINRNILHAERFIGQAKICFIGLSIDLIKSILNESDSFLFPLETRLNKNPILQFMKNNLKSETTKEYQDLFPKYDNTKSIQSLIKLTDKLVTIMMDPTIGSTFEIKALLCEMFDYLGSNYYASPIELKSSSDSLLFSRIQHLLEDTDGRLTRSELSDILNYNGSYLNSIVQRYTGMSIFNYGMTYCFKKAEYLLLNTDDSISDIANKLKFNNRTHFYNLFKKQYGITPQEFRNKNKK